MLLYVRSYGLYLSMEYKFTGSDNDEERSFLLELNVFVHQHYLFELPVVHHLRAQVVEVVRLSYLITELTMYWHRLHLAYPIVTLRCIVAPDSRSPNLKNPVVM